MRDQYTCTKCGETKAPEEFYAAPGRRDGLSAECRTCAKARSLANKRARAARRDRRRAVQQAKLESLSLKVCRRCGEMKRREHFHIQRGRAGGLCPYCKPCQRTANAESKRRHGRKSAESGARVRARAHLATLKSEPCIDCGRSYPPKAMHFHHREPSRKTATLASLASRGAPIADLNAEAAKCDLLCAICHVLRHEGAA